MAPFKNSFAMREARLRFVAMSNLWAPWRMEYILGKKGDGCIFCAFPEQGVAKFRENLVLVVQEHAFVGLNRYPFIASHLLVVPRRHTSDLTDLAVDEYDSLMRLVRESTERLKRATRPDGVNIGVNLGKAAGAGIAEHLHVHIVPRWNGDTNFMPAIAGVHVMPEYLDDSWRRLHEHFRDLPGEHASFP